MNPDDTRLLGPQTFLQTIKDIMPVLVGGCEAILSNATLMSQLKVRLAHRLYWANSRGPLCNSRGPHAWPWRSQSFFLSRCCPKAAASSDMCRLMVAVTEYVFCMEMWWVYF